MDHACRALPFMNSLQLVSFVAAASDVPQRSPLLLKLTTLACNQSPRVTIAKMAQDCLFKMEHFEAVRI